MGAAGALEAVATIGALENRALTPHGQPLGAGPGYSFRLHSPYGTRGDAGLCYVKFLRLWRSECESDFSASRGGGVTPW